MGVLVQIIKLAFETLARPIGVSGLWLPLDEGWLVSGQAEKALAPGGLRRVHVLPLCAASQGGSDGGAVASIGVGISSSEPDKVTEVTVSASSRSSQLKRPPLDPEPAMADGIMNTKSGPQQFLFKAILSQNDQAFWLMKCT